MIKPLYKIFLSILFLLFTYSAFCQTGSLPGSDDKTKPDDKSNDGTSSFKFGVSYLSNNVFMGRTDTTRTPMAVPQVKYTLKQGIYFSGSLDFLPDKKKKKLDGGDITAGYDFDITDNLSGNVSYAKLFYSSTSTQIAAAISSTFNANFTYDVGSIISPSVSADYNLNKQGINNDVFVNLGLTHDFITEGIFGDKDIFLISPTATVNTGSQNFYDEYLTKKKVKTAKLTAAQNALLTKYINQLSQYTLLDYELSAPLEYKAGHFIFQFTPTYAIVKNQLPKTIQAKISDQPTVFYFETGVFLKF
jgi:hypothetical protein